MHKNKYYSNKSSNVIKNFKINGLSSSISIKLMQLINNFDHVKILKSQSPIEPSAEKHVSFDNMIFNTEKVEHV